MNIVFSTSEALLALDGGSALIGSSEIETTQGAAIPKRVDLLITIGAEDFRLFRPGVHIGKSNRTANTAQQKEFYVSLTPVGGKHHGNYSTENPQTDQH
jgi:hypothetical protein